MTTKKSIGEIIEKEVRKRNIPIKRFAELISCQRNNVYDLFKRSKIDIIQLKRISEVLNHNFFQDLANDLDLINEKDDKEKENAVSQFHKVVPEILHELNKDGTIIQGDLPEDSTISVPDYVLGSYFITFTVGETFKERAAQNPLLPIETITNGNGIEVELLNNILYNTKTINIKIDYKTKEQWYRTLIFAFELCEQYNIRTYGY